MGDTLAELKERYPKEERCPETCGICYGGEVYYFCGLTDKTCQREYGGQCYIYDDFIRKRDEGN